MPLEFYPRGVIPATLLAFDTDLEIDEGESRRHLQYVAQTEGITAITVNGHASEVHACSFEEQKRVLALSLSEVGDRLPLVNGVYADGSREAARIARMAQAEGASALLCFPPNSMAMGGRLRPEMAIAHFSEIAAASDIPLICFNYPAASGLGYPFDTLTKLFETVPTIVAIKDWCNDPKLHERHIREFQGRARRVSVLTTHSAWLMSSLVMGCDGLLSGAGSVIADLQVELFEAVQKNDLARARAANDRIYPMAQAFYADPFLDMHNRMKEAAVLLGRQKAAHVRPPLMKLSGAEIATLRSAIASAGLQKDAEQGLVA